MTVLSNAVPENHVSAIVGYAMEASLENLNPSFLYQKIVVLAQSTTAKNATASAKLAFTASKEVADDMGAGCPAHMVARILRPVSGDKLGSIITEILFVGEAGGAVSAVKKMSITGTATKNKTHFVKVAGRKSLDGQVYSFVVETGDQAADIAPKIRDAVNAVYGCPVVASLSINDVHYTANWKGASSEDLTIEIDTDGDDAGITYAFLTPVAGAGVPSIDDALAQIGNEWATFIINTVGTDSTTIASLEAFIGNAELRTGRYGATNWKPAVAFTGSKLDTYTGLSALSSSSLTEMANSIVPFANTPAFPFEGVANIAFLYAPILSTTPNIDMIGKTLPDMPTPEDGDIGELADENKRDLLVKAGISTTILTAGKYEIVDLVTTYSVESAPQTAQLYRYVRDIMGCYFNFRYLYLILENIHVKGKTLLPDSSTSTAPNTISPKRWKSILLTKYSPVLIDAALMANSSTFKDSLRAQIGTSNPNRFETLFNSDITGTGRATATTNRVMFNINS